MKLKIVVFVALAVILQSSLRVIWPPSVYVDLVLIVVVYFALRRDALESIVIGAGAGLAGDALSTGLLGAGGFTRTLTAYLIAALSTRIQIDNPLLKIPVLAGAVAFDALTYEFFHRMFGRPSHHPFVETVSFKLIGTTIAGTVLFYILDLFFSEEARRRRQFAFRRRIARRGISRKRY